MSEGARKEQQPQGMCALLEQALLPVASQGQSSSSGLQPASGQRMPVAPALSMQHAPCPDRLLMLDGDWLDGCLLHCMQLAGLLHNSIFLFKTNWGMWPYID